jgi:hypothetical protein
MSRLLPILTAIVLLLGTTVVHGLWTQRWKQSERLEAAAAALGRVPMNVGDWKGKPIAIDAGDAAGSGLTGFVGRRYEHQRTGAVVSIYLVCGRPGQVAVHTPDVCYPGAGYEQTTVYVRQAVPMPPGQVPAETFTAPFAKQETDVPSYLRIFWTWSAGKGWKAEDSPRWAFAGYPVLYKLYALRVLPGTDDALAKDPTLDLLQQLLPALDKTLFPSAD